MSKERRISRLCLASKIYNIKIIKKKIFLSSSSSVNGPRTKVTTRLQVGCNRRSTHFYIKTTTKNSENKRKIKTKQKKLKNYNETNKKKFGYKKKHRRIKKE